MSEGDGVTQSDHQAPLRVAVVGSGPSGFYAAEALLRSARAVHVTMVERLPTPFGLVRSGVAPDHPKLKQSILVYDRISRHENFHYLGNVTVGTDVTAQELLEFYHAVIYACGAQCDRSMGIPGEDLAGSHTATEFVGWYNGHPDFRDCTFDLTQKVAVIVGHGNVAADVCRILAKPVEALRETDIAAHALDALAQCQIEEIHLIGRRGPAQAKFSAKELRELGDIPNTATSLDPKACDLGESCQKELADVNNTNAVKNVDLLKGFADPAPSDHNRKIVFRFCLSPIEIHGKGHVEKIICTHNDLTGAPFAQQAQPNGTMEEIPCGLVFRSIGYCGVPIEGVPFDATRGVVPNEAGKVIDGGQAMPGHYVTGWFKRGPTGIIGTNRADSIETVESLLADFDGSVSETKTGVVGLRALLQSRGVQIVDLSGWHAIDAAEIERGMAHGKPREKFTRTADMLAVAHGAND